MNLTLKFITSTRKTDKIKGFNDRLSDLKKKSLDYCLLRNSDIIYVNMPQYLVEPPAQTLAAIYASESRSQMQISTRSVEREIRSFFFLFISANRGWVSLADDGTGG